MSEFEMKHIAVIVVFDVRTSGLGIVAAVQAHNGMVPDIVGRPSPFSTCRPEGQTDSEFAFCQLLAGIVDRYDPNDLYRWLDRINIPDQFRIATQIKLAPEKEDDTKIDCVAVIEQWFVPLPPEA